MPPPVRGSTSCSPADSGSRCHGRPGGRSGTTNHGSSPSPLRLTRHPTSLRTVRAQPGHLRVEPGATHERHLREICDPGEAAGDLVQEAILAAIAFERRHRSRPPRGRRRSRAPPPPRRRRGPTAPACGPAAPAAASDRWHDAWRWSSARRPGGRGRPTPATAPGRRPARPGRTPRPGRRRPPSGPGRRSAAPTRSARPPPPRGGRRGLPRWIHRTTPAPPTARRLSSGGAPARPGAGPPAPGARA